MRDSLKNSMKKWAVSILSLAFLLSALFSLRYKDKAQSDYLKDTLSFLLLEEDKDDFIDTLEKFNKSHENLSVVYINHSDDYTFNPDGIDNSLIDNSTNGRKVSYNSPLSFRVIYRSAGDNILAISTTNSISYYVNPYLLLIYLSLLLLVINLINEKIPTDKKVGELETNVLTHRPYGDNFSSYDKITSLEADIRSLNERLAKFTTMTSNMKEGFILFDDEGNIEIINDSAKKYLSINSSAKLATLIDSKEYLLALREASLLKRSKNFDTKLNGYYLRIFIDPMVNSSKTAFSMIIIDNSEDKKAELMRREFSANVTHELKSPLTSINGYAELIATGIAKEDDVTKFAEIIYQEGNRLLEIIDDILKISRLDEQNFDKDMSEIDVYEVVRSTIEKYQNITNKKEITVTNNTMHFRIKTSKSLFYDLVSNIYENAIKYNKVGGSIEVSAEFKENNFCLIIKDTGIGIATKDTDRIFERFYVVDKSRKRNQKSTGLGLSIVKHIASYLGYEIKVKSILGEGSKFTILIPLKSDR